MTACAAPRCSRPQQASYDAPAPQAATLSERVIAVSSLSKAYGLLGLRSGWIACRDRALAERFLAARALILIAGGRQRTTRRGEFDLLEQIFDEDGHARAGEQHFVILTPQLG